MFLQLLEIFVSVVLMFVVFEMFGCVEALFGWFLYLDLFSSGIVFARYIYR